MHKGRIEAFSDGVFAIIITIMVLELKVPHGEQLSDLAALVPVFLSYLLSFIYVGIYWNNHHHLFQAARHVSGGVLWANLHLLFWLSLMPFVTAWAGENHFGQWPIALYGFDLLMCGFSFTLLSKSLVRQHDRDSVLAQAVAKDIKGKVSVALYIVALIATVFEPKIAGAIYIIVALIWLVPDTRIENKLGEKAL